MLGVQTLVPMSQHGTESIHSVGLDGRDGRDGRSGDGKVFCGRGYLHGASKQARS